MPGIETMRAMPAPTGSSAPPPLTYEKSSVGKVSILPRPIKKVSKKILDEIKKEKRLPARMPGKIMGMVTYQRVFMGFAPNTLACSS